MATQTPWGAPYGGPSSPPPSVHAKDLRPRRVWYLVAALSGLVLAAAGAVLIVVTVRDAVDSIDTTRSFSSGESRTLHLTQGKTVVIYMSQPGHGQVDCRIPGLAPGSMTEPGGSVRITLGSRTWERVFEVTPDAGGAYTLTCTSERPAEFAVGDKPHVGAMVGGIVAAIGCFLAAFLVSAAIVVVTAVRRSRHRRRLAAMGAPAPQWGPPRS